MSDSLKKEALRYHSFPTAGKVSVTPTKALDNQRDLSLAYSPGVAYACQAIEADPLQADYLTSRANLVAVISNGSAVRSPLNPSWKARACSSRSSPGLMSLILK